MHLGQITSCGLLGGFLLGGSSLLSSFWTNSERFEAAARQLHRRPVARARVPRQETAVASEQSSPGGDALKAKGDLLRDGRRFLESIPTYSATFRKQEVVDGELLDEQVILLKYRREPTSIYLRWLSGEKGREVLYVEGRNDGRLLAHEGGWKSRLPAFSLSPDSKLAMQDTRYPVTQAGFEGLIDLMLNAHEPDLSNDAVASCEVDSAAEFQGRKGLRFTVLYRGPDISPVYRKSITFVDQEWKIPLKSDHYGWPEQQALPARSVDDETLIEAYEFTEVDFDHAMKDHDFQRDNPEYQFR